MSGSGISQPEQQELEHETERLFGKGRVLYGLSFRWNRKSVEALLWYFREQMINVDEIEFWSIWLDNTEDYSKIYTKNILLEQLDYNSFERFYDNEESVKKFVILKNVHNS